MRILIALLLFFPTLALSQGAATLVANSVVVTSDDRLVATGNIEVFYDGTRLSAAQISYDPVSDRLAITGPILIQAPDGTILTADRASLDPKMENGMLRGARLVLNQQLQLAATQINRVDGRYSQLYKVAATSCQVCGTQAPLWEIRAKQIVHDGDAQQLYFTGAQLLVRGVPIFWIPRMRLPDPSLKRATGWLSPNFRTTDQLRTGVKLPYFIRIGDHRDLTLTPYVSSETTTLELRYRQAFMRGDITIDAAVSEDTLMPDTLRSYLFLNGDFDVGTDYKLTFDVEIVSDPAYLLDYGFSEKDRLDGAVSLLRVRDTDLFQSNLTYFQTLRDDEDNASLPPLVASTSYEKRAALREGTTLTYVASADSVFRYRGQNGIEGRDVSRLGAYMGLTHEHVTRGGMVLSGEAALRTDWFEIKNDDNFSDGGRIVPSVGVTISYPLATVTKSGAQHLVEPMIALGWADGYGITPPNEDSTRIEFDEANLFDLSRFSGEDAIEAGLQIAVGGTWTRLGPSDAATTLSFGRVFRDLDTGEIDVSANPERLTDDWLLAGQHSTPWGLRFDARTLFDDQAELTRAATFVGWQSDVIDLSAAYIWQAAEPRENRPDIVSEWSFDGAFQLTPSWNVQADARYDLANDQPARAGLGIEYQNECVKVDLSVSRRYTSSTTVEPSTSYGLSVTLNGFSANGSAAPAAACRK